MCFLLPLQKAQSWLSSFPWINNRGLCSIKDNNRFLDLSHPSPRPAWSLSLRRQGPVVKRQTQCRVTIKHYTQRVEATVVKQVLISHPFAIPYLAWSYSLHMLRMHSHLTHTSMQMLKHVQILIQKYIWIIFDLILMAFFMRLLDISWIITQGCIILILICDLLWCSLSFWLANRLVGMDFMQAAWEVYILSNCLRGLHFICLLVYLFIPCHYCN